MAATIQPPPPATNAPNEVATRAPSMPALECLAAAILLALLLAAFLKVTGATASLSQRYMIDEVVSHVLITDPSPSHMIAAFRQGVDSNVPGYELFIRALAALGLPATEFTLRLVAVICTWLAMVFFYATLRRHVDRSSAFIASIGLLASTQGATNMLMARTYAPWLMTSAAICYLLPVLRWKNFSLRHLALMLLVLFSTILHYFGFIAIATVACVDLLFDSRRWRKALAARWPLWLGMLPAFAIYPYFYFAQRHALATGTWALPTTLMDSIHFISPALAAEELVCAAAVALGVAILCMIYPKMKPHLWSQAGAQPLRHPELLGGLVGFFLFAFVLVLFSHLIAPAYEERYAMPALLGSGLLIACLLMRTPPRARLIVLFAFLALLGIRLRAKAVRGHQLDAEITTNASIFATLPPDQPVWCESIHRQFPLVFYYPQYAHRIYLLHNPQADPQYVLPYPKCEAFEHDFVVATHNFYPQFQAAAAPAPTADAPMIFLAFEPTLKRLQGYFAPNKVVRPEGAQYQNSDIFKVLPPPSASAPTTQ